jgi:pimeloyl-ACP methyl ester carboxylesterase
MLFLTNHLELVILAIATIYHSIASFIESRQMPANLQLFTVGGRQLAVVDINPAADGCTIILDHSLGGVEGHLLVDSLAKYGRVVVYNRGGYGWSQWRTEPRHSGQIIQELAELLASADIPAPYLLIGDSFGSYNMRLFAARYPDRVAGLVLTDGLDPEGMLNLPWTMGLLKIFFGCSFYFVAIGAALGIIRLLGNLGIFELIKPQLRQFPKDRLNYVKRSFYSPLHWWTMGREIFQLDRSGLELSPINDLGSLPIVNIKAETFLRLLGLIKLATADRVRDRLHQNLMTLSTNCQQIYATGSSHFVWIDRPDTILTAVEMIQRSL